MNISSIIEQINSRIARLSLPIRIFLAVVILPTLLATFYYGFIASDIYVSEAKYAIRANSETPSFGLAESFMGSISGSESTNEDANIVMDFIHSRDVIMELDRRLGLRKHYASSDVDIFSRFDMESSLEDLFQYYLGMVTIIIDSSTKISTLRVRAFDPLMSKRIAEALIELSEDLVNNLSNRMIEDSLTFARGEMTIAETRVRAASSAIANFRKERGSMNPSEETVGVLNIIADMEGLLAKTKTELLETQSYMQNNSTQVQVLENKVAALTKQVEEEKKRLYSDQGEDTDYTQLIDDFEPLQLELELATQQYTSTIGTLELARIDAQRKQRYLLPFVPPQTPDEAVEPNRIKTIMAIFISLCLFYAIGGLVWAAIKDHMRL